ncbi:hypothetical protein NMY22_g7555 [Coprinellus aureogranulatus]|nr:hypothetical protein NMY22_g7555 [Coprinellus aureogranulatus]
MPGDYAQHLESGTRKHGKVNRHHITQAVQMLGVVPPITITPSIEFHSSTLAGYDDTITSFPADAPSTVEAGPPLSFREEAASFGPVVPEFALPAQGMHLTPFTNPSFDSFPSYTPNDFIHLGIPYACPLCLKTFRNVNQSHLI